MFKNSTVIGVAICVVELQRMEFCILQELSFMRSAFGDNIHKET
jgi:hypothetical protein